MIEDSQVSVIVVYCYLVDSLFLVENLILLLDGFCIIVELILGLDFWVGLKVLVYVMYILGLIGKFKGIDVVYCNIVCLVCKMNFMKLDVIICFL